MSQANLLLSLPQPDATTGTSPAPPAPPTTAALTLASLLASVVWARLPPTSFPHASLTLSLLRQCCTLLSQPEQPGGAATASSATAGALVARLGKVVDLLDKAGGAMRGLGVRQLLTPVLRPAVAQLSLPPPPASCLEAEAGAAAGQLLPGALCPMTPASAPPSRTSSTGGGEEAEGGAEADRERGAGGGRGWRDGEMGGLSAEAQGMVHAFVTQHSLAPASKFLKALQVIFAAPHAAAAPDSAAAALSASQPVVSKVLAMLPPSLPYLCLLCKAFAQGPPTAPTPPPTVEAWAAGGLKAAAEKLSPGQLRAWAEWALFGNKQPLPAASVGKLVPHALVPDLALAVTQDVAARLPEALAGARSGKAAGTAVAAAMEAAATRLCTLCAGLSVVRAAVAAGVPYDIIQDVQAATAAATAVAAPAAAPPTARQGLMACLQHGLQAGWGVDRVQELAASALPNGPAEAAIRAAGGFSDEEGPGALVAGALETVVAESLATIVATAQHRHVPDEQAQAAQAAMAALQAVAVSVKAVAASQVQSQLGRELAGALWARVDREVEALDPATYGRPAVGALLDLHASLAPAATWGGGAAHGVAAPATGPQAGAAGHYAVMATQCEDPESAAAAAVAAAAVAAVVEAHGGACGLLLPLTPPGAPGGGGAMDPTSARRMLLARWVHGHMVLWAHGVVCMCVWCCMGA